MRFIPMLLCLLLVGCGPAASRPAQPPPASRATSAPAPAVPPSATSAAAPSTAAPATEAPAAASVPTPAPAPASSADLSQLSFALEPLVEGFSKPTHVTAAGDGSGRLFVTEQLGAIWIVRDGVRLETPFLDIRTLVQSNGNEQGLLSVAFHPQYAQNGRFFVGYTDRSDQNVVAAYQVSDDPDRADQASGEVLLAVADPAPNHNGGLLKFGPDGYLYVGMGDGGGGGDPWKNGQNLDALLGKILRLDVDGGAPYAVPADNPFVGRDGARGEIWAFGLRNPWRFSFDRATGDLYIADVGQNEYEEVHFQPAESGGGENYGWSAMEGDECFRGSCDPAAFVAPVATYAHADQVGGCSITGGYVYRGSAFPQIAGVYLYTDYCTGHLWAMHALDGDWVSEAVGQFSINTSSFGEDEAGELYLTDRDGGGLYRLVVS
jgi:glucose/arabinose dehydrogenase